jgi:hypothetical protein
MTTPTLLIEHRWYVLDPAYNIIAGPLMLRREARDWILSRRSIVRTCKGTIRNAYIYDNGKNIMYMLNNMIKDEHGNLIEKPIVHFSQLVSELRIGCRAHVWPVDHTSEQVDNDKLAYTSVVTRVISDNEFYTKNSHYIRRSQ